MVVDEAVDGGDLLLGEQPRADLAVVTREPGGRAAQLALVLLPAFGQKHVYNRFILTLCADDESLKALEINTH